DLAKSIVLQLDLRRLRKKLGAEHALDCAQIAAGLACEIALKSLVAETGRIVVEAEEQSCRHRRRAMLDGQQTRSCYVADANGGVRRAKIYAARECHVLCFEFSYRRNRDYRRSLHLDKSAIFPDTIAYPVN